MVVGLDPEPSLVEKGAREPEHLIAEEEEEEGLPFSSEEPTHEEEKLHDHDEPFLC